MKTLVVYYSKTGNTKKVAEAVIEKLGADADELKFDDKAKTVSGAKNPADYERVILMSPVWAFTLATPMKLYLRERKSNIGAYRLIVTCDGLGLRGCVRFCEKTLGKPPEVSMKIRAKELAAGNFDISAAIS